MHGPFLLCRTRTRDQLFLSSEIAGVFRVHMRSPCFCCRNRVTSDLLAPHRLGKSSREMRRGRGGARSFVEQQDWKSMRTDHPIPHNNAASLAARNPEMSPAGKPCVCSRSVFLVAHGTTDVVLRSCAASCRPVYPKSASRGNRRHSGEEIPPILAECPHSVVVRAIMDACICADRPM